MEGFRKAAIAYIREIAGQLSDEREFIRVSAHLFAIASEISVTRGDLHGVLPGSAGSLSEAARRLSALSPDLPLPNLFLELVDALLTVEGELRGKRDRRTLEGEVELPPYLGQSRHLLGGRVHYWMRPPSVFAQERERRYREAGEKEAGRRGGVRSFAPEPRVQDHLEQLCFYWERKSIPRLVRVDRRLREIPLIQQSGHDAMVGGSFRVALCPLTADSRPQFEVVDSDRFFQARRQVPLEGPGQLADLLTSVLEAAEREKVHLLVLPELTIPLEAREHLAQTLRRRKAVLPYGVIAGSFHFWDAPPDRAGARPVNEACLLDRVGRVVLRHQKRTGFRLRRRLAVPAFFPGGAAKASESSPSELFEGIEGGSDLTILDTSLGRLAVVICFDALAADPERGLRPLVQLVRPDLLFVLSMSPKTSTFEPVFEDLATHWIGTLYVNAQCICRPPRGTVLNPRRLPLLAYYNVALQEHYGAPPTQARWRTGVSAPECTYHHHGPRPEKTGVEVHPLLGMVVDLGVHWDAWRREQGEEREREQQIVS